ncbi:uncharacterized protein PITG_02681 [Phytophthora infestans T30-4]|uniref:Uncharacterized protein n=1 Tax=Phytophthora infestans (strain T30-4) TaxID=403677 RepID=D0MWY8_PHYIT|nr:uncharacterized protein PITG_02681 [Phytophthora infestans T30-4]EEY64151.1 hypothetical protein PITG_02681 [Phytophthora infestans T30-4]|eukprot:XP_002907587.1 hypothetical protein PITG_02681 [Phytophthora infestans T30-4]
MKSIEIERHHSSGICRGSNFPGVFVNRGLFRLHSSQSVMYFLIECVIRAGMTTVIRIVYFSDNAMFQRYHVRDYDPILYCFSETPQTPDVVPRRSIARRISRMTLSFVYR